MGTEDQGSPPTPSPRKLPDPTASSSASALELPIVMVSAILIGGGMGYLLDRWLHTKPWLMLVFGGMGFYAGVRDVLRRVARDG